MKDCCRCSGIFPTSNFQKRSRAKDGFDDQCKPCRSETKRVQHERYKQNPEYVEKRRAYSAEYNRKNPSRRNEYIKSRKRRDIGFRIAHNLRSRISQAVRRNKGGSAVNHLGCSIQELRYYLESKFTDGMTWENYGQKGWHIDHIKPLISFDLTDSAQCIKAFHYTNLQPLWAKDNVRKGGR